MGLFPIFWLTSHHRQLEAYFHFIDRRTANSALNRSNTICPVRTLISIIRGNNISSFRTSSKTIPEEAIFQSWFHQIVASIVILVKIAITPYPIIKIVREQRDRVGNDSCPPPLIPRSTSSLIGSTGEILIYYLSGVECLASICKFLNLIGTIGSSMKVKPVGSISFEINWRISD